MIKLKHLLLKKNVKQHTCDEDVMSCFLCVIVVSITFFTSCQKIILMLCVYCQEK